MDDRLDDIDKGCEDGCHGFHLMDITIKFLRCEIRRQCRHCKKWFYIHGGEKMRSNEK